MELDQETRKTIKDMFNQAPCGIGIFEINTGKAVFLNDNFYQIIGYSREDNEETVQDLLNSIVFHDDPQLTEDRIRLLDKIGKLTNKQCHYKRKDGKTGWLQINVTKVNLSGETYAYGTFMDITKQKEVEIEKDKLINKIPSGIAIYKVKKGKLKEIFINDGFYEMVGSKRDDRTAYRGYNVLNAVHPDDLPIVHKELAAINRGSNRLDVEYRIKNGMGTYMWIRIIGSVIERDQEEAVLYCSFVDVNSLVQTQKKLEQSQAEIQIATENLGILYWVYKLDQHQAVVTRGRTYGYDLVLDHVPERFRGNGDIYQEDEADYFHMFELMERGVEKCECCIRILNHYKNTYRWQHIIFTKLTNNRYISSSVDVSLQQEQLRRYQTEMELRKKLFEDSVLYYKMNLTKYIMEEYQIPTKKNKISTPFSMEGKGAIILENVEPSYRKLVENTLFPKHLLQMYTEGVTSASCEYRRLMKDNKYRWVRGAVTIITEPETNDVMAFVNIMDIDDEKMKQEAIQGVLKEEMESIIIVSKTDKMVQLVMENRVLGGKKEGDVFPLNQEFYEALFAGIIEEDMQACRQFIHVEYIEKELEKHPIIRTMYRIRNEEGKIQRKKVRAMYLDQTKEKIVYVRRDITDLYIEEQKQKQRLENAIDESNAANQAKTEFLSSVSHDMRTPLNAIIGFSGKELLEGTTEKEKEVYLEKINKSGEYLLGIINNVLDMSKIESQKMVLVPEEYNIHEFEDTMDTIIGEQCRKKNIQFIFESRNRTCDYIMVDKVRFNQIFVNLLSNAVKYTPEGGKVELLIEHLETDLQKTKLKILVRDNGIGMSKEFIPHAFDSFSQEIRKERSLTTKGTGLGLTIVKELVELMGGSIHLESELEKGTTYIIRLDIPIVINDTSSTSTDTKKESLQGIRILLCEDHPLNIQIAKALLEKKMCYVEVAENGKLGVDKFMQSEFYYYDVILMDIRMPVMDGLEASKHIRNLERPDAKTVPIIAMTANAFAEDAEISKEAGMMDHLTKPIDPKQLYATIQKWVRK